MFFPCTTKLDPFGPIRPILCQCALSPCSGDDVGSRLWNSCTADWSPDSLKAVRCSFFLREWSFSGLWGSPRMSSLFGKSNGWATDIWSNWGNHTWVGQSGAMMVTSAASSCTFCRALPITLNGGKAYALVLFQFWAKTSIALALGSGCHAKYSGHWLLRHDANKSMSNGPNFSDTN